MASSFGRRRTVTRRVIAHLPAQSLGVFARLSERARRGVVLIAATLAGLAFASHTQAHIYWTSGKAIGRANLDGTNATTSLIAAISRPGSLDVTVDAAHIYWADFRGGKIGRANLDGTSVERNFMADIGKPAGVAVDESRVYWADEFAGTIGRANLDGTDVEKDFITGAGSPYGPALDAAHIYWADLGRGNIGRANLDGTGVDPAFIRGAGLPGSVEVDAGHVYWSNLGGDTIGRANLDGSGADKKFMTDVGGPSDLEVDATHIYWGDYLGDTIARANLDGSDVQMKFITRVRFPGGLAIDPLYTVDATRPKTKITEGAPDRTSRTTVTFNFTSSEPNSTFQCKLDRKPYERCKSPKTVNRLADGKHKFKVRAVDAAGNVDPSPAEDNFRVIE